MSDWGATHSTVQSANSGLDMQMPDATYFGDALAKAIVNRQVPTPLLVLYIRTLTVAMVSLLNGQVPVARLDDMVLRILTAMYMVGIMDTPQVSCAPASTLAPTRL